MTPIEIYSKILKLMMPGYHKSLKLWAKTKGCVQKRMWLAQSNYNNNSFSSRFFALHSISKREHTLPKECVFYTVARNFYEGKITLLGRTMQILHMHEIITI